MVFLRITQTPSSLSRVMVIQQWTSVYGTGLTLAVNLMGGGTRYEIGLQGTFFFPYTFPESYPISIMYKNLDSNSVSGAQLSCQSEALGSNESIPVPSSRLYPFLSGCHHVTVYNQHSWKLSSVGIDGVGTWVRRHLLFRHRTRW